MSMKTGQELGSKLVEILGLPKNTRSFTLHCHVNKTATVTCEYFPDTDLLDDENNLKILFSEYELKRVAGAPSHD